MFITGACYWYFPLLALFFPRVILNPFSVPLDQWSLSRYILTTGQVIMYHVSTGQLRYTIWSLVNSLCTMWPLVTFIMDHLSTGQLLYTIWSLDQHFFLKQEHIGASFSSQIFERGWEGWYSEVSMMDVNESSPSLCISFHVPRKCLWM